MPYGAETCSVLVELDNVPSASAVSAHVRIHMLACAARAPSVRAGAGAAPPRRPTAAATAGHLRPPPRRLLQNAAGRPPALNVAVMNMSSPLTVFLVSNASASRMVLAAFSSLSVPAAADSDAPSDRYCLIVAPRATALGAAPAPHLGPRTLATRRAGCLCRSFRSRETGVKGARRRKPAGPLSGVAVAQLVLPDSD